MTYQGGGHFACDECPEDIATGEGEFRARLAVLNEAGWKTFKGLDGEWAHSCPDCVAEFAKRKRR